MAARDGSPQPYVAGALKLAELHGQHLVVKLLKQPPISGRRRARFRRPHRAHSPMLEEATGNGTGHCTATADAPRGGASGARGSRVSGRALVDGASDVLPAHASASPHEPPGAHGVADSGLARSLREGEDDDLAAQIAAFKRSLADRAELTRAGRAVGSAATVHGGTAFAERHGVGAAAASSSQLSVPWTVHDGRFFAHHVRAAPP